MFGKKNKENKSEELGTSQVDQDLIVHNMPAGSNSMGSSSNRATHSNSSLNTSSNNPHKFKIIGALIIGLGIILVAVLIYLSYRFLINPKPTADSIANNQVNEAVDEQSQEDNSENVEEDSETKNSTSSDEFMDSDIILIDENEVDEDLLEVIEEDDGDDQLDFEIINDTDSDGLTDEEEVVMGTDIDIMDSDSDNYLDLEEMNNGYNPAGDGLLEDNKNLTRYYNSVANYSILHPKDWMPSATNNDYTVIMTLPDNSLIQITVQANNRMQGILAWYKETVGEDLSATKEEFVDKNWDGLMGVDGRNFYLTDNEKVNIYVISYIPVISDRVLYPNIFEMMINSFRIE